MENKDQKNLFLGQVRNKAVPFDFVDMSLKRPFDEKWKTQCRERIKSCDAMIVLISSYTRSADGQRWEIKCAIQEEIPVLGIWIGTSRYVPPEMMGRRVVEWEWRTIKTFIESL